MEGEFVDVVGVVVKAHVAYHWLKKPSIICWRLRIC